MTVRLNRHAKKPVNTFFFKNNVKYDRNTKILKYLVRKHNYKLLNYPFWKVKVLKKLGRKYKYKFKKAPFKRKLHKRTVGSFYYILQTISFKNYKQYYLKRSFKNIWDDYKNFQRNKVFFFKEAAKSFLKKKKNIKKFRRKITIRRIFAQRLGISSNKKFYNFHKKFKKKRNVIIKWLNFVEFAFENFIFNLGWTRSVKEAKFFVWDNLLFLNGSKKNFLSKKNFIDVSDNLAMPIRKKIRNFKRKYFFKKIFSFNYYFKNWYKFSSRLFNNVGIRLKKKKNFYKQFWSTRKLEWRLITMNNLKSLSWTTGKKIKLFDHSNKKISISLYNKITFYNFLNLYKSSSLFVEKRKMVNSFLHNHYF